MHYPINQHFLNRMWGQTQSRRLYVSPRLSTPLTQLVAGLDNQNRHDEHVSISPHIGSALFVSLTIFNNRLLFLRCLWLGNQRDHCERHIRQPLFSAHRHNNTIAL